MNKQIAMREHGAFRATGRAAGIEQPGRVLRVAGSVGRRLSFEKGFVVSAVRSQ